MGKDNDNDNNKGISRRDALKRMGLFVAGAAALSMPSALTSCGGEKKKRIILYFTATGNSFISPANWRTRIPSCSVFHKW